MPVAIAIVNSKGGVGKTTLTRDLGGAFVALGRRVALVDLDCQASLTSLTHGLCGAAQLGATVASLFDGSADLDPARLLHATRVPGLSILPGSELLRPMDMNPSPQTAPNQYVLAEFLAELDCDVILIDCPPSLGICTWAALLAAAAVVVPIAPEHYGALALTQTVRVIRQAQATRPVRLLGYVVTVKQRLAIHQKYVDDLRAARGDAVFLNEVPRCVEVVEAAAAGLPVVQYKRRSRVAKTMLVLAGEILQRLDGNILNRLEAA